MRVGRARFSMCELGRARVGWPGRYTDGQNGRGWRPSALVGKYIAVGKYIGPIVHELRFGWVVAGQQAHARVCCRELAGAVALCSRRPLSLHSA